MANVRINQPPKARLAVVVLLPLLLSFFAPIVSVYAQDEETGTAQPEDLWSYEYANSIFPWGPHGDYEKLQFREYHDYFSMKERMQTLADFYPEFLEFHEGLKGGTNARGNEMTADSYEGWYYGHSSPWLKITGNVQGGEYNEFNGDHGNYVDRPDVMLVGNHHAREWMSYEVPMLFLETLVFYYGKAGIDNDGDGQIDEDPWDGIDNDGDCALLNNTDSNGDGTPCGPGDLGVDEDFSEQWITDLVNTHEIYLIPMLNVDGNRYDREEYCGEQAWENCPTSGWRKNLRDNTVTGVSPIPDTDESVDEGCDGVDLNRNYQFEWGAPLGATGPLIPGACYASGPNNDVYNGPVDTVDQDGDLKLNEDGVDGKDDDADGLVDEDWLGGNSEPETLFIQDMTEMNDDDGDGASDYKVTLTWHSFSELVLYPWGHCTNCQSPDHDQLIYHGDKMAEMTLYENMQSSDLYPTTGDFCDWHYGVHGSYCYTIEIGTAFHQKPEDIRHIAVRNLGVPFYMIEISDAPRERAELGMSNMSRQWLETPSELSMPEEGDVPIVLCLDDSFPYTLNINKTHVMWRLVKPTRQQSDYGPTEWIEEDWQMTAFEETEEKCTLSDGDENGTKLISNIPIPDDESGIVHYKSMLGTTSGLFMLQYPEYGQYYVLDIAYRAPYGNVLAALFLFTVVATFVWGGLGIALREMLDDGEESLAVAESTSKSSEGKTA
ncbi:MAG: M14 family zinc carboxypeptidase [Candidatus Poseidoniaceae archaeon]|nr:M14 family zinc carboxypeptidase [Candidatus Poseidoniaceae archaeon]